MQTIYDSMIENTVFLGILGLERGLKILDQIFLNKMGMSHILLKIYNCFNAENICLHHEKRCFSAILTNFAQIRVFLGIS